MLHGVLYYTVCVAGLFGYGAWFVIVYYVSNLPWIALSRIGLPVVGDPLATPIEWPAIVKIFNALIVRSNLLGAVLSIVIWLVFYWTVLSVIGWWLRRRRDKYR